MATLTVTGGANQPNISLTFNNGTRNIAEAQSIANIFNGKFSSVPATYVSPTSNPTGVNSGAPYGNGYLVVESNPGALFDARGFQAITFTTGSTVLGGASTGQSVLGGGSGLDFIDNSGNSLVEFSSGANTYQDSGTRGSTIFGGSGNDTYDVGGSDTIFAGTGSTQVNLSGSGFVSLTGGDSGSIFINGGSSGAAASTVVGGAGPLNITVGSGNYSITGSAAGSNTIIGGSGTDTLTGAGNGDYIQAGTGNTTLIAGSGAEFLQAGSGSDSLVGVTSQANGTTLFGFANVADTTTQAYQIGNFNPAGVNGGTGDNIYVANSTDANYVISTAHQVGANVVATLNGAGSTIVLTNTTITGSGASATINGQNFANHVKSVS